MNRRQVLARVGAAAGGGLAGCLGGDEGDGGSDGNGSGSTGTSGGSTPRPTDRSFARTGDCDAGDAGFAGVTYGGSTVRCEGCITGPDGCAEAALESAAYDADADRLSVTVTTRSRTATGGTETGCTQQLVHRSYEATLSFAGGLPAETVVYHESMGERAVATRASARRALTTSGAR